MGLISVLKLPTHIDTDPFQAKKVAYGVYEATTPRKSYRRAQHSRRVLKRLEQLVIENCTVLNETNYSWLRNASPLKQYLIFVKIGSAGGEYLASPAKYWSSSYKNRQRITRHKCSTKPPHTDLPPCCTTVSLGIMHDNITLLKPQ